LVYREWKSGGWGEARSLGAPVARDSESGRTMPVEWPLAGCSGDATRIDLFARSPDGDLLHMTVRGDTWGTFEGLGAPATTRGGGTVPLGLGTAPAACSWGPGRIDGFARGSGGEVLHKSWDGHDWSPFVSLGMPVSMDPEPEPLASTGAIAACSWGPNRLDVFTRAVDGNLYHAWWDGSWTHD